MVNSNKNQSHVTFGLIADVHQDIIHDATKRISAFTTQMNKEKVDFICQLGDFCLPHEGNREFLQNWEKFKGKRYHVLGNHDMDGGFSREQNVTFLKMPKMHYSFDNKGIHFIVLDGNDEGGDSKGYNRFISNKQLNWLRTDLDTTTMPTIIFSHQTLDHEIGIENSAEVRKVLEATTFTNNQKKVIACFCGHHHIDESKQINGIHYFRINSSSYKWVGKEFKHESYSKKIHQEFPYISCASPYKKPLWATVEINIESGHLKICGQKSSWVGSSPSELSGKKAKKAHETIVPYISDHDVALFY